MVATVTRPSEAASTGHYFETDGSLRSVVTSAFIGGAGFDMIRGHVIRQMVVIHAAGRAYGPGRNLDRMSQPSPRIAPGYRRGLWNLNRGRTVPGRLWTVPSSDHVAFRQRLAPEALDRLQGLAHVNPGRGVVDDAHPERECSMQKR